MYNYAEYLPDAAELRRSGQTTLMNCEAAALWIQLNAELRDLPRGLAENFGPDVAIGA